MVDGDALVVVSTEVVINFAVVSGAEKKLLCMTMSYKDTYIYIYIYIYNVSNSHKISTEVLRISKISRFLH